MAFPTWTDAQDTRLKHMRASGAGWREIALALGVSPDVARERGRRIGAGWLRAEAVAEADPALHDPAREPLPAGHPHSWGLLSTTPWPGYALPFGVERAA
jgi:hypothetical protein